MLDILVNVLGFEMVSQALRNRESAKAYSKANPRVVSLQSLTLSYKWKQGKPKEYLESLPIDLQQCLVCNLANEISEEILAEYGF
jgi:hypothetical protein